MSSCIGSSRDGHRPLPYHGRITLFILVMVGLMTPGSTAIGQEEELPDLVPLPPYNLRIALADDASLFDPRLALRFTAAVANRDSYAFDIMGVPNSLDGDPIGAEALQCVTWLEATHDSVGVCQERASVGGIIYHDEHAHWHLERFVTYELRRVGDANEPIWDETGLVGQSRKVSFCLQDVDPDSERPEGAPEHRVNLYSGCATLASMGISPGWRDVYDWHLYDQQIELEGVADGTYALTIVANPDGRFLESDNENNSTYAIVEIEGERVEAL